MELIVTFLGILELIKIGRITIEQECLFDDIIITYLATDIIQMEEVSL
jgi:segregation and condensation protein A